MPQSEFYSKFDAAIPADLPGIPADFPGKPADFPGHPGP